jgi:hypothetical protein
MNFKKNLISAITYFATFMLEYSMNEYTRHTMHATAMTPLVTVSRPAKKCIFMFSGLDSVYRSPTDPTNSTVANGILIMSISNNNPAACSAPKDRIVAAYTNPLSS